MTSEERNRKIKYGHRVPRSWIPDFNLTHKRPSHTEKSKTDNASAESNEIIPRDYYTLRRRSRMIEKNKHLRQVNKDIKLLQKVTAALMALIGFLSGGSIGLGAGVLIGLLILSFRIDL